MNCRFCLLVIIFVSLWTSCANSSINEDKSANAEEVTFDDGYKTTAENEIVIEDKDFEGKEDAITLAGKSFQEITKIASDNSKISTMFDRYGNKTETRYFNYDTRLSFILLRTSADGKKQVFVYGQNGEVKNLPENMLDKVLTAPANDLANAAGIYEVRRETQTPMIVKSSQTNKLLTPLPGSSFPVQIPKAETVPPVTTEDAKSTPTAAPKPTDDNPTSPKKKDENPVSNN